MTMRFKAIIFLLFSLHSLVSFCQPSFGIRGGTNTNGIKNSTRSYINSISVGSHFGVYAKIPTSNNTSVKTELVFTKRGSKDVDLNYLEIPILFSFTPIKSLDLDFGGNIAIKILSTTDYIDTYRGFDFGLCSGLTFRLNERIMFVSRYFHGLSSIKTIDYNNNPDPLINVNVPLIDLYNRSFQLSLGYKIK
jgi:hypothetical protein